ncbi:MAG: DUF1156 domain-containing protein [Planctomycetes bacterium]|nr:DUF1156 domain-containing protein [Planctomycetota bacterium]
MSRPPPRLLIEDWLPAAAIGVECMRERSTGQQPPDKRLHVWWARRPLTVSRAAVLGSLLPADFPREVFERLLGFWGTSKQIVDAQKILDWARTSGERVDNPHGGRAFKGGLRESDLERAHVAAERVWGKDITVIDPMAGGGSIPLESARLGFHTLANEYNPVACSILEATVDYPLRFGEELGRKARQWGAELRRRFNRRMEHFYPKTGQLPPHCYVFARTVPCPDTQFYTPLVPDWHLLKPKTGLCVAALPIVDRKEGTWTVAIREIGARAGQLREVSPPTFGDAKGISLFTGHQIPTDYIKTKARAGQMKSALYAVAFKTPQGIRFQPPEQEDLNALAEAERELKRLRLGWEKANLIPTEALPMDTESWTHGNTSAQYGATHFADLFSPRQILCMGVLVEESRRMQSEVLAAEGAEMAGAIVHLLAFVIDKLLSHNSRQSRWDPGATKLTNAFERHDFAFRAVPGEMALCNAGSGLDWAIDNVLTAYDNLSQLPRWSEAKSPEISQGSATTLPQLADGTVAAVVVDPPYAGNVLYSELADFFYVWLKPTQGHRHPEWFATHLCERDHEAVVNIARFRDGKTRGGKGGAAGLPKGKAQAFYQAMMTDIFRECRRILREDGVLTVMFTHKKQEAWKALFESLIRAGFTITATWPVKTESEHSLHQAKKNAAQSTVILVARKRPPGAGVGYFDSAMQREIRDKARTSAGRLQREGLNAVDQLVGSFGPAIEAYSRYDEVKTDTGEPVGVERAIDEASRAVSVWREEQLATRGLEGVEPEGRFALLCWDVLGAAEFRFNEAKLLGNAVGMDVDRLVAAGLVEKSGEKIKMLSAKDRRRSRALEHEEVMDTLFGPVAVPKKRTKKEALKVHPNDPKFRTTLDACHALALRFLEADGKAGGIGSAKALARQQQWTKDSPVARLMEALVRAAPEALRHEKGKTSTAAQFPEFRAWHALLEPLFGAKPPDWTEKKSPQRTLAGFAEATGSEEDSEESDEADNGEG